ncbi:hypothetical protein PJG4_147 [Pseudomonas phage JG004]|uniref:Uncharacterized protein n=6 Tax=Pakpunavirus TaxID=1921407 RepID=F4YDJ4_9CAUD|nr:hypothetical protein PJG4_147 [Pseudomonas phage JG004]ADF58141.1 hypothetical protein PJG4_147 [Pseudomonas phage JG004]
MGRWPIYVSSPHLSGEAFKGYGPLAQSLLQWDRPRRRGHLRRKAGRTLPNCLRRDKMQAWNVYQNGQLIDIVFFDIMCGTEEVRKSLVNHDGYPSDITVEEAE